MMPAAGLEAAAGGGDALAGRVPGSAATLLGLSKQLASSEGISILTSDVKAMV